MKKVIIIPPSFLSEGLLEPLIGFIRGLGFDAQIIQYPEATDGESLENRAQAVWEQIDPKTRGAYVIGLSSGGVIAKMLADGHPECFSRVMLYATPMLCQKWWRPVSGTFLRYLLGGYFLKALIGRGVGGLNQRDSDDWLWGGFSHSRGVPESWTIVQQMMFESLSVNQHPDIQFFVIGVRDEFFHQWSGAREWGVRSLNTHSLLIPGTHFGALRSKEFFEVVKLFLNI